MLWIIHKKYLVYTLLLVDENSCEDEEEEEYYDDLFCVACNKAFKSDKA